MIAGLFKSQTPQFAVTTIGRNFSVVCDFA